MISENRHRDYSVLMSVYYKEKAEYLRQAIESIQMQTWPTDDFVLVCDGPLNSDLDNVIAAKQKELGTILNVVRLPENAGLGNALNEGIKFCKNELIARMDSDDISFTDRCEKQVALFEQYEELDITSGTLQEFVTTPEQTMGRRTLPLSNEEIRAYSKKRSPFNHPCVMFKRSAVEKAGNYQEKYHLFEDYDLWIRMLQSGCIGQNIADTILYMRTPTDMYLRRGGKAYAKEMLKFHWWVHKSGWTSLFDFCTGAIPHAVVCVLPNELRYLIYKVLH